MKLLALPLLLLGAGAGWFSLQDRSTQATEPPCASEECRVTVQCTGPDTCLVTCTDENDQVVCQREVTCDEPCEKDCSKPCDKASEKPGACSTPCTR
jgi:hypothetical protein